MNKPQPISGFPELLPTQQLIFQQAMDIIRETYQSFGFIPLDTPVVERLDTLLAKGAEEKEIYGLRRIQAESEAEDGSARELGLRFDLTVPLARYVAQHAGHLNFPFRRYHMAPVWRGERPQKGRYRQFYQCDIDVIGDGELGLYHDAEMPAIIYQAFKKLDALLGLGPFTIRLNNRKILTGFLAQNGVTGTTQVAAAMRIIDDLEKMPREKIITQLGPYLPQENIETVLNFFAEEHDNHGWLKRLQQMATHEEMVSGVQELQAVTGALYTLGVPAENFQIDPAIARGLGYYTGTIYETKLRNHPKLGSVCSGGRYDNLAEKFTNKKLPGVGISIGLSRLLLPLLEDNSIALKTNQAPVLITVQDPDALPAYLQLATDLRQENIPTEVYLEPKKLPKQLKYAAKRGCQWAIIANAEELNQSTVQLKNLFSGDQETIIATTELINKLKSA